MCMLSAGLKGWVSCPGTLLRRATACGSCDPTWCLVSGVCGAQARASGPLVEALYRLEDYGSLARLARALPPRDPLLTVLGERLAGVGLAHEAVEAYLAVRAGGALKGCM